MFSFAKLRNLCGYFPVVCKKNDVRFLSFCFLFCSFRATTHEIGFRFLSFRFLFSTVRTQLTVEMLSDLAGEFRQPLQILIADFVALRQTDIRNGEL